MTAQKNNAEAGAEGEGAPDTSERAGDAAALKAQHEADMAKLRDQWMRALADTENLRKRAQRDVEETAKYAVTGFARDLVSVLENLQRAAAAVTPEARAASEPMHVLAEGIELTLKEMLNAFERHGIRRVNPLGQKFDHNYHQAVTQVDSPDTPPGTVVQVLQPGYTIHDRLLRPAMVGVARQAEPEKKVDTLA